MTVISHKDISPTVARPVVDAAGEGNRALSQLSRGTQAETVKIIDILY